MDGRKNNGGARKNAGRKKRAEEEQIIWQLDSIIERETAVKKLKELIEQGNIKAIQLYFNYLYGKPTETRTLKVEGELPIIEL